MTRLDAIDSRIEGEPTHAGAVQQPDVLVALHRPAHDHATPVGGDARLAEIVLSGSPTVPRTEPDRSNQVSWRWFLRRPVGHQPGGRHRNAAPSYSRRAMPSATVTGWPVSVALRDVQPLGNQRLRARPYPQQPARGQIHAGAGWRASAASEPRRRASPGGSRKRLPRQRQRTETGGRQAESTARVAPCCEPSVVAADTSPPVADTRIKPLVWLGANTMTPSAFHVPP